MPAVSYRLYGLTLESRLALPCVRAAVRAQPDVRLRAGNARRFARARQELLVSGHSRGWFQHHRLADGTRYLRWARLFEFLVSPEGRRIQYLRLEHATRESFGVYLLGQVLSFSLLALGLEALHGTVVEVDGEAVAFVGDCGYGKSTLGAAMLARGRPILTDDLVALESYADSWRVHPGIPRLKLYPSVARAFLKSDVRGTPLNRGTSKLVLPLDPGQSTSRALPLRAIYVLPRPRRAEGRKSARVHIEELSSGAAFLEVLRATFNPVVVDSSRLANQFDVACRLAAAVPVRRLTYRRDLSLLPAVCDAVLGDLAGSRLRRPRHDG